MKTVYQLEKLQIKQLKDQDGNVVKDFMQGVLKRKPAEPKNAVWEHINVSISPLLRHRIENNNFKGLRSGYTFESRFESDNLSPHYDENPFRLMEFTPIGDSDIPRNFKLELVTERVSLLQEIADAYGNKEARWKSRETTPKYFQRWMKVDTDKKISECKKDLIIVV